MKYTKVQKWLGNSPEAFAYRPGRHTLLRVYALATTVRKYSRLLVAAAAMLTRKVGLI